METTSGRGLLHDVLTSRVYDVARETPLEPAARLSRRLGHSVRQATKRTDARILEEGSRRLDCSLANDRSPRKK